MGPSKESIDGVRPIWEAAFKDRAEVTQAVADMLEILPLGNDKSKGVQAVLKSMDVNLAFDVVTGVAAKTTLRCSDSSGAAWRWRTPAKRPKRARRTCWIRPTSKTASRRLSIGSYFNTYSAL